MNPEISPKTIWIVIIALVVGLALFFTLGKPHSTLNGLRALGSVCAGGVEQGCAQNPTYQSIGSCRECVALKDYNIPFAKNIGEYVDWRMAQKLAVLTKLNTTWRITEAYPATVKHLSFCHTDGTCVDIGLFASQRTSANLSQLCADALRAGLVVLNEYIDPKLNANGSSCPSPNIFETTTGGNLHLSSE